jgi:transposase
VHHSKPIKERLAQRKDKIEMFYLPSYGPELDPEERLNTNLKQTIGKQYPRRPYQPAGAIEGQGFSG